MFPLLFNHPLPAEAPMTRTSIVHQIVAMTALAAMESFVKGEAPRKPTPPADEELERRDQERRRWEREVAERVAADRAIADKYQAERLARKEAALVKRQPYTVGFVVINGTSYPAQQQPPDGNFRKRSTRFLRNGQWSEWCKDDHDLFVANP